jgi:nitric oxide reductase large subunit
MRRMIHAAVGTEQRITCRFQWLGTSTTLSGMALGLAPCGLLQTLRFFRHGMWQGSGIFRTPFFFQSEQYAFLLMRKLGPVRLLPPSIAFTGSALGFLAFCNGCKLPPFIRRLLPGARGVGGKRQGR